MSLTDGVAVDEAEPWRGSKDRFQPRVGCYGRQYSRVLQNAGVGVRPIESLSTKPNVARLIDACITHLKAQGPSRTCNESKEEVEDFSRVQLVTYAQCTWSRWVRTDRWSRCRRSQTWRALASTSPTSAREIGMLLPNNQRHHRTLHIQEDVLLYALS